MRSSDRSDTRRALLAGCLVFIAFATAGCSSRATVRPEFFWNDLFSPTPAIVNGIFLTIVISIVAQALGVILGVFAAMAKMAKFLPFRWVANLYIWFFRGTPLLVQLFFFRFGIQAAGLFVWPTFVLGPIYIPPEILAGTLIIGVNEGAYMAEIVRAGILSVDPGQTEAAKSLGMTYGQTMSRIVLPQAARVIIPPLGNEFNNMLKTTSLLSVIGVMELYNATSVQAGHTYATFELFAGAAVWYLLMTTIWGFVQSWIERRLAKGSAGTPAAGPSMPGWRGRFFGSQAEALGGH